MVFMKKMIVTRPNYDDATSYSFYYAGIIIKEAENKGIAVIDLKSPRLTRKNFENLVQSKAPLFLFFNAHGSHDAIYGDKIEGEEEILVKEGNHQILDSKLIFARTCWAAASLGRKCKGGCFIGYKNPFSFYMDEQWSAKPSNDNTAKIFFEPSNAIPSSLLKGNTAEEAVKKSLQLSKKTMLQLLKNENEPGVLASVNLLWNNIQGTAIFGNAQMKFE